MNTMLLQAEPVTQHLEILDLLMKGGLVMIPLMLLSVITLVIIFERILFFNKNLTATDKKFNHFVDLVRNNKWNDAAEYCNSAKSSWGRIFIYAATADNATPEETDKLMEDAANVEISRLEKSLNYLTVIAGVAPLLGFIGTIAGVITIFFDISVSKDISIAVISEGLYKKMVSSASGLVIGIMAFTAYHLFVNQVDGFATRVQEQALKLKVALQHKKR
jgi:biopolymer transport protein ExbB